MPVDANQDRHASDRAALDRTWIVGQCLAEAWRGLQGILPIAPEELVEPDEAATDPLEVYLFRMRQMSLEAFLFCLSAALNALIEEAVETVLMAEGNLFLSIRLSYDLQQLERCGAIPSADQVLDIQERVRRQYLIATLAPDRRAKALNQAWSDSEAMIALLVHLSRHLQSKNLIPGLLPFDEGPP